MALAWFQLKFFFGATIGREVKSTSVFEIYYVHATCTLEYAVMLDESWSSQINTIILSVLVIIMKISAMFQYCLFDQTSQIRLSIALFHVRRCLIAIVIITMLEEKGQEKNINWRIESKFDFN